MHFCSLGFSGALPWGFCTPSSPPSPPLHTHRRSFSSQFRRGEKYLGLLCHLFHGWKWHSDRMKWMQSQQRVMLLRVMLIEHKNVTRLKGKRRSESRILAIDWWIWDLRELRGSNVFNFSNLIHTFLNNCLRVCAETLRNPHILTQ